MLKIQVPEFMSGCEPLDPQGTLRSDQNAILIPRKVSAEQLIERLKHQGCPQLGNHAEDINSPFLRPLNLITDSEITMKLVCSLYSIENSGAAIHHFSPAA
jgi:hypothetical protein